MITYRLSYKAPANNTISIPITGSKSETNRLLILKALFPNLTLKNGSISDDSKVLKKALQIKNGTVDIHHAGTAMRFLTAYFAFQEGCDVILTGSSRMQERPIGILVDALREMGAAISYVKKEGFPPLKIKGKKCKKNAITIAANVSSQYISALMLMGASLENGLIISLDGKTTSIPYIKMTEALLKQVGIPCVFSENKISTKPVSTVESREIVVESDWSSASYFYSIIALSNDTSVTLTSYKKGSLQGDSALATIYKSLGVTTLFSSEENKITLKKNKEVVAKILEFELADTPDIAQTIAVTCFGLGVACKLTGLHTLKIKETDRLLALKTELEKLGATVAITNDSLALESSQDKIKPKEVAIDTYNDHRMAMAFAPLAIKFPIAINDPEVVSKSFPSFWETIEKVGIFSEK